MKVLEQKLQDHSQAQLLRLKDEAVQTIALIQNIECEVKAGKKGDHEPAHLDEMLEAFGILRKRLKGEEEDDGDEEYEEISEDEGEKSGDEDADKDADEDDGKDGEDGE